MLEWGVTTVEIKSGYGLTIEDELKMLRAIKALDSRQPVELAATYLAAHAVPAEFEGKVDAYLDEVLAFDLLERINGLGTTIVMVTHDSELAARAPRQIHLLDGQLLDLDRRERPRPLFNPAVADTVSAGAE